MVFSLVRNCAPSLIALLKFVDTLLRAQAVVPEISLVVSSMPGEWQAGFSKHEPSCSGKAGCGASSRMASAVGQRACYRWLAAHQDWPVYPEKRQPGSTGAFLNKAPERDVTINAKSSDLHCLLPTCCMFKPGPVYKHLVRLSFLVARLSAMRE